MKLLFISFYFTPDLSAGSFRAASLVKALRAEMGKGAHIELITTLPNRYSSFSAEALEREELPGLTIHRVKLPAHNSGMRDQVRAYLTFALAVFGITWGKKYDLVLVTSGRLMSATLGALISRLKRIPLYLDIRDIFVDTIKDVFKGPKAQIARYFFSFVEKWTISRAREVNLVSQGFAAYFSQRYPDQHFTFFTNGIDEEFLSIAADAQPKHTPDPNGPITITYAGNIGAGQGLEHIIPPLAKRLKGRVQFQIIGDGGARAQLETQLASLGCTNVEMIAPIARKSLLKAYAEADVLFLHLNDYDAFRKVLPSKLFEYAATGKPIWAGIAGYSAEFAAAEISNVALFNPCDVDGAITSLRELRLAQTDRSEFVRKYARDGIAQRMAKRIASLV